MPLVLAVLQNCIVALGFFGHVQGGPTLRRDGLGSVSLPENSLHMNFRRHINSDLCYLWVETYLWTGCKGFSEQYGISMAESIDMNPSVASDCDGWVGGSKYCVLMRLGMCRRLRHGLPGKSASAVQVRQPPAAVKGARATPGPELHRSLPSVGAYQVRGCYAEPAGGARSLPCLLDAADMTVEKCIAAANVANARYAGLEYGRKCWYGNILAGGNLLAFTDNCVTMTCLWNC
ncbi:hypothetical protein MCOR14_008875 [Pyricularia oryzae]|nr:hypothetical protein MCOR34_007408 [Pyricularia oryzae]KAI6478534.1 hypothetical protein MCOR17_000118 [Pyricularia oryzae]KAI6626375.1 hypothetical protein MCOR14_008875 [Pyricularia oryzae]